MCKIYIRYIYIIYICFICNVYRVKKRVIAIFEGIGIIAQFLVGELLR